MPPTESSAAAARHLRRHAVRTDGPFMLRSGRVSSWYLDARQTTFSGEGARLVGAAVWEVIEADEVAAVGGMTLGADPISVAAAVHAAGRGRPLRAFSIRKQAKEHGTGGRLAGPVGSGDRAVIVEDTATTGGTLIEALDAAEAEGLEVVRAVVLVDRSGGEAGRRAAERGVPYTALFFPADLGVDEAPADEGPGPPEDGAATPEERGPEESGIQGTGGSGAAAPGGANAPLEEGGPAPEEGIPGTGAPEDTPDIPVYEGVAACANELEVHRRFPRRWYLALVGAVLFLHGGGVLGGWAPVSRLLALVFPPPGAGETQEDISFFTRVYRFLTGELGASGVREGIPGYETRDLTWAWLFLIVGAVLILWAGGRIAARLTGRRPAVRAGPDGLHLSLLGPWRRPAAVPWDAVGGISAGRATDSRGGYPALRIEAAAPSAFPANPWGARWTDDDGVLAVDAQDWRIPPEETAERLADIMAAAGPPPPPPAALDYQEAPDAPPASPGGPPPDDPDGQTTEGADDPPLAPAAPDGAPGGNGGREEAAG